ncbi:TetR/AcrR family transcriptional regulator [Blastopirellula sp. JC732]|uniref:TetR/AcrR family transcriptional regulator n=1 Tax=Blastopirellula sediminis TaxID=2894196 RepID=A0A9X1SEJ1_9BACT|nr:TetR/AcrR family transcriptional regulator [Blastopirellula sediminis]MCC9609313.1 TetR/AcrR family transcriptional regulator [Blastopirellula sediminis]MCC9627910.1 TetR/AcrR family transcriptional regulator [Blastopirellula sediminis]
MNKNIAPTDRKDSILRAAASLCAKHGIAETNLRQIAQGAGVSNGTLHYHFPSKDELIETLILRAVEPLGRAAAEIAEADGDPFAQLQQIVELSFGLFDDDWDLYFVALQLGDRVHVQLSSKFPTATSAMQRVIERGQRMGLVREEDPLLLAIQCHGVMMRVARAQAFGEIEPPLRRFVEMVGESMRRMIEVRN